MPSRAPAPGGERWSRADARAVALAACAWAGAWVGMTRPASWAMPLWLAVGGVASALAARRPVLLCLAAGLMTSCLAQRAMAGLEVRIPPRPFQAAVTLLTDPAPDAHGGVQVEVGLDGRRWSASAHGAAAAALDDRLAGERVTVRGRRRPPGTYERRMVHRHLVGRLDLDTVLGWREGHGLTRAANRLRRTVERGAAPLPPRQQALLLGLALGDDRRLPADLTAAFRSAGLGHLTAVSGQNVTFLLIVATPLLARVRLAPRLVLTLALLAGFALVTRAEPSVLRATAMAAVSAHAAATGRPSSSLRTLALAVTGLLLCDPLLSGSLGFQLSVAGAAGIILGAGTIGRRIPGPRLVVLPLAMTCAAQLAVAPLLISAFGPLSLAALPANVLAAPAAGPAMVWGLTGGLLAGVTGGSVAALLQVPSRLLLGWVEAVAQAAARWPLGEVQAGQLALVASAICLGEVARASPRSWVRRSSRPLRLASVAVALVAVLAP